MNNKINRFLLISLGVLIMAIGLYYFLIPAKLAVGGVTGLAMVINKILPKIPIGFLMTMFNIILFIMGFLIIGKEFGGYTVYASFLLSGTISLMEKISPLNKPIVDDLMLSLIYGIVIQGIGMGIIFNQNSSTGGTDIVAKIINKLTHLNMGKALLLSDFIITVLAMITFGTELGLYALLGVVINAYVIDNVIAGFNSKVNMMIISIENKEINKYIIKELERGTTLYTAQGGFSNDDKIIINTIVGRKEYIKIKKYVKTVDSQAFIIVGFVNEVFGEGFTIS